MFLREVTTWRKIFWTQCEVIKAFLFSNRSKIASYCFFSSVTPCFYLSLRFHFLCTYSSKISITNHARTSFAMLIEQISCLSNAIEKVNYFSVGRGINAMVMYSARVYVLSIYLSVFLSAGLTG